MTVMLMCPTLTVDKKLLDDFRDDLFNTDSWQIKGYNLTAMGFFSFQNWQLTKSY